MAVEEPGLQALEYRAVASLREAVAIDSVGDAAAVGQQDPARQFRIDVVGVDQKDVAQPRLCARHRLYLRPSAQGLAADHRAPGRKAPGSTVAIGGQAEPDDACKPCRPRALEAAQQGGDLPGRCDQFGRR